MELDRLELEKIYSQGYGFYWKGKGQAIKEVENNETEYIPYYEGNLYIEGDNLIALKRLQKEYRGKIKCIYIDPPYNTNKKFLYNDKFSKTKKDGLSNGDRIHTNWLNMMYPRLSIARDLLTDDGVICIQIDDNEQNNLKKICDEIFGESNFVTTIAVKMSEATGVKMSHASSIIPKLKEYILIYGKGGKLKLGNINIPKDCWDSEYKTFIKNVTKEEIDIIKNIRENESRTKEDIEKCDFILSKFNCVSLRTVYKEENILKEKQEEFNFENAWRIIRTASVTGGAKELADKKRETNPINFFSIETPEKKLYFIKSDYDIVTPNPRIKLLFADDYLTVNPCDFWQDIKTTGLDNEGGVDFKNGKKPLKLILRLMKLFLQEDDIVLDFFSGSATTAHAVMQLNAEDGGNRKYIMVQLPEPCDEKSEAYKAGYKNICEIGKERIRRAGKKIKSDESLPPENREKLDTGFMVVKL